MCSQFIYIYVITSVCKGWIAIMKKIYKNNKGFTLVEIVIVIAIIILFSVVFFMSVSAYLSRAKTAATAINTHNQQIANATSEVDAALPG